VVVSDLVMFIILEMKSISLQLERVMTSLIYVSKPSEVLQLLETIEHRLKLIVKMTRE
jgi:hypothetical protein